MVTDNCNIHEEKLLVLGYNEIPRPCALDEVRAQNVGCHHSSVGKSLDLGVKDSVVLISFEKR